MTNEEKSTDLQAFGAGEDDTFRSPLDDFRGERKTDARPDFARRDPAETGEMREAGSGANASAGGNGTVSERTSGEIPGVQKERPENVRKAQDTAQKSASQKSAPKKAADPAGKKKADDTVRSSTAERKGSTSGSSSRRSSAKNADQAKRSDTGAKIKKEKVDLDHMPRSTRPAHKVIPYILFGFAAFLAICLLLNLIFNGGNRCESNPASHPMGSVGYYLCYGMFGIFGPAVFTLPLLLVNLAYFWKTYVDNKLVLEKIFSSLAFLILFSTLIHVFCLVSLAVRGADDLRFTAAELLRHGARMTGGGLIGGGIGYFLFRYLNIAGSIIVSVFLTVLSVFFFLGMTPQHLWDRIRARRNLKKAERMPLGPDEEAPIREQMRHKHDRAAGREIDPHPYAPNDGQPPEGAVRRTEPKRASEKSAPDEEDGLAPMPLPVLDATGDDADGGTTLYLPKETLESNGKKPAQPAGQTAPGSAPRPAVNAAPAASNPPAKTARQAPVAQGSAPQGSAPQGSAQGLSPAAMRARDEAVIAPIFPRNAEPNSARKMQKSDRNFELGNIFVNLDDHPGAEPKQHAPLPPEVPLPGSGMTGSGSTAPNATTPGANGSNRPVPGKAPVNGAVPRPAGPNARPAPAGVPAGNSTAPRAGAPTGAPAGVPGTATRTPAAKGSSPKTEFRPAGKIDHGEFGLSDEEFEKREADLRTISNAVAAKKQPSGATAQAHAPAPKPEPPEENKPYTFPPISYLHPGEPLTVENQAEINEASAQLESTLNNFHINGAKVNYSCGPTVTRYEIFPPVGVRVRSIMNLADDIALAFKVPSVRMEPIEGKSAIGVEVPNKTRCTVYLRELLESPEFTGSSSRLCSGLGADVAGTPLTFDVAKMPHLLVGGTTGSGKSICINCIIMSILYKARPDEVKLIMIDPKKVEFSLYKGIPHLMAPIIVTPKDAAGALQAAVNEMEDRFTKIQDVGVHDIAGYNKAAAKDPDLPPMPHIVIIIDELADLMMTARDEVEDSICRLAQKARAAGMHIIVGTQRPSVDVVTGLIKSNIPSRIACTVRSQVDSRTILDFAGAEKLLGKGDMLFAPVGAMRPTRVQGAFVSDAEVEKVCEFIRATNGTARYNENFTSKMKEYSAQCGKKGKSESESDVSLPSGEGGDNKYIDAIRISIEEKRVSTSLLQRKLGIGYSRAAKIIDRMEEEGLVSKPDGSKPRSILITPEQFIERYVEGNEGQDFAE